MMLIGLLAGAACSAASLDPDDAGTTNDAGAADAADGGGGTTDAAPTDVMPVADVAPALTGRRSYVVTSTYTSRADAGAAVGPGSHTFTIVLDWDTRTAIAGSLDGRGIVPVEITGGGVRILQPLSFSPSANFHISYQSMELIGGGGAQVTGTGLGQVTITSPISDTGVQIVAVAMSLAGVPDTQAPRLVSNANGGPIDVFGSVTLTASEPLPPTTRLVLVDRFGDQIPFAPTTEQMAALFQFSAGYGKLWRYDDQYTVVLDGLVDFAGNPARAGDTISFATGPAPPTVAEDGFESATGATLAGAQVLSGAGAPTISGTRSLYIPALPGAFPPGRGDMTQLALRMPVASGDTVVRFSYRTVNPTTVSNGTADPYFLVGVEGGDYVYKTLDADSAPPTSAMIGDASVSLGPVMTAAFALPPGGTGQLVLTRKVRACCSQLPAPAVAGLIIDDLRAE